MRPFGELEAAVMERLWSRDGLAAVREVLDELNRDPQRDRRLAYTTVMTVMDNLHRKGWLRRQMPGRAYLYEPVWSREQYSARLMTEALADSSDPQATLVHFLEAMPAEEATALQALLRRARRDKA